MAEEKHERATDLQGRLPLSLVTKRARPLLEWSDARGAHAVEIDRRLLVGSSQRVHAVVDDRAVSRVHAELEPRDTGVWIRDLGSSNGTWVNGVLVESALVADGAAVRLGATTLRVRYDAEAEKVRLWPTESFGPLHGRSERMRELFFRMSQYAERDASVLVQGETGTGKELIARALHDASPRAAEPFVIVDCAALPETLLESELFGHAKGAFTGAVAARAGAIEAAHGGTVFLDEIGELPLSMQPKLLRAIESRSVRRVGEANHREVDVRFVSATHRDLHAMVGAGAFREDLYFRLAVLPLHVPPLRARRDDVPLLLERMLADAAGGVDVESLGALADYPWLGNVRELRNFAERVRTLGVKHAVALLRGGADGAAPLDVAPLRAGGGGGGQGALPAPPTDVPFKEIRELWNDHLEREYLSGLLQKHGRNVSALADAAGLDRSYVHRLMRKHDL